AKQLGFVELASAGKAGLKRLVETDADISRHRPAKVLDRQVDQEAGIEVHHHERPRLFLAELARLANLPPCEEAEHDVDPYRRASGPRRDGGPVGSARCCARQSGCHHARKLPHRGTTRTRPSSARMRSTRVTVALLT